MNPSACALLVGRSEPDQAPIRMTDEELLEGIAVEGPPGRGKRSVLLALLAQQVARGGGVLFLEGRPSRRALGTLLAAAEAAGRLEAVRIYEPSVPARSHRYNPLLGKGAAALAAFLLHVGAPPARRAGSAVDARTRRAAEALAAELIAAGGPLSLATVRRRLALLEPADRKQLEGDGQGGTPVVGPATWRRRLAQELDRLLLDEAAALPMAEAAEIDLGDLVSRRGLLYVALGTLADAALAASLAALVLADLRVALEGHADQPAGGPGYPLSGAGAGLPAGYPAAASRLAPVPLLLLDAAEVYLVPPLLGLLEATPRTAFAPVVSLAGSSTAPSSPVAAQVLARLPARLAHRVTLEPAPAGDGRPGRGVVQLAGRPPVHASLALDDAPVSAERTEAIRARLLQK